MEIHEIEKGNELTAIAFFSNYGETYKFVKGPQAWAKSADSSDNIFALAVDTGAKYLINIADFENKKGGVIEKKMPNPMIIDVSDNYVLVYSRYSVGENLFGANQDHRGYYLYKLDKDNLKNLKK